MIKDTIKKVNNMKQEKEIQYVCFLNDKTKREDSRRTVKLYMGEPKDDQFRYLVEYGVEKCAEAFILSHDFDYMIVTLNLGILYDKNDLFADNKFKVGAEPIKDLVYVKIKKIDFYLDSKKQNTNNNIESVYVLSGYMNFDEFLNQIEEQGLAYNGPESFRELKASILYGPESEATIGIDFTKTKEENQEVKKTYSKGTK